jgi:hypothetical protein
MMIEKKAKGKGKDKGKAIIGIAMAAIMVASVFVVIVPTATAVAPGVTVDKKIDKTTLGTAVNYIFTTTNSNTFVDMLTIAYSAAPAGWAYSAAPAPQVLAPGGSVTWTLTVTPPAVQPPVGNPSDATPTVTVTNLALETTSMSVGCYLDPLTYQGLRNVIPAPAGAYDPSNPADPNYIPPNAVLIGQDLDLSGLPAAQLPATIIGDPTNPATAGEIFTTDVAGIFDAAVMTVPGIYYINPTGGSSTTAPTSCWGVLAVVEPTMNLDLRVSGTSVSSITQGTPLQIRFVNNLNANDMVTLKIIDPDGNLIKSTEFPSTQKFSKINVRLIHEVYGVVGIDTTDWTIGTYTFQVKTDEDVVAGNGARGLDVASNEKTLTIRKSEITISADQTTVPELKTVRLTVTGVTGHVIRITTSETAPWQDILFPGGLDNNPPTDTTAPFTDTIDADGKRTYAVEFLDTGAYMITVTDTSTGEEDTVDITVEEKAITFDMPAIVTLGEKLTIKGTANTGDWVAIAFDDVIPAGYDRLTIYGNGEFSKDIATGPASPSNALKAPGSVHMKAFINWVLPAGQTFPYDASDLLDDGTTKVFLLNDAGGGIDISASGINVAKNETIILTIEALPDHNVSVTTANPAHTVFEYNRYDFTGTSTNIINIAPADTISIPADTGDCGSQADAMNIHGVWKTMNADGIRKFEVHFTDIGTYKITIEIIVSEKDVTFDVPSIVALGEKITIKGTSNTGDWVAIAFDDRIPAGYDRLTIGADGEFSKEIYTGINSQSTKLKTPGSVRVTAFIDLQLPAGATLPYDVSNWPLSDDGSTKIFLVPPSLTAELSNSEVALGDSFTVSGTAKGPRFVDILTVSPKGPSGNGLGAGITWWVPPFYTYVHYPGCTDNNVAVSETDYTFSKILDVRDTADTGTYLVAVLSRGIDGQYGDNQGATLERAISNYAGDISTKTQEQVLSILKGLTARPGSDDLMRILTIKVGWTETLTLNTIADVVVGNPLEVTGETSRKDGSIIWITVKKPYYEIVPQAAIIKDNKFSATFDTTGAQLGTYTVKADDGYGYTDTTTFNLVKEKMSVSISSDKHEYSSGNTMYTTIRLSNPTKSDKNVLLEWWIAIPELEYREFILAKAINLPAGFGQPFTIPIPVGDWGSSFDAQWHVVLLNPEKHEVVSGDIAYWSYVSKSKSEIVPSNIAREIKDVASNTKFGWLR